MGSRETTTSPTGSREPCGIRHCRFGFTLIEVILIAAVIGILLAASIPKFQQTAQRLRAEQAAFGLTQLLRFSHELSVTDGAEVVWAWEGIGRTIGIWERGDEEGAWSDRSPSSRAALGEAVSLAVEHRAPPLGCPEPVAASACVHFFPDGTSEPATVMVQVDNHSYRVTVDAATSDALLFAGPAPR